MLDISSGKWESLRKSLNLEVSSSPTYPSQCISQLLPVCMFMPGRMHLHPSSWLSATMHLSNQLVSRM